MKFLANLSALFFSSLKNLVPVLVVILAFWWLVVGANPDNFIFILLGLVMAAAGIALFLQGLEMSIFPLGESLSNKIASKGSLMLLLAFGFSIGFGVVIAEPSLIVVAEKTQLVTEGRIDGFLLRLIIAISVGFVLMIGLLRVVLGHSIRWYMLAGYTILIPITFLTPKEITGIAFDMGPVSANIVTVPLVTALGIGLASSIRGRNALMDGFGLVGLVALIPRATVQLYGVIVYGSDAPKEFIAPIGVDIGADLSFFAQALDAIIGVVESVAPLVGLVLFFQLVVMRKALNSPVNTAFGVGILVIGLAVFVQGLKMGLFAVGEQMATQLADIDSWVLVLFFVFLIGFAATLVEPSLLAVAKKAEEEATGRINAQFLRVLVAIGVGLGIVIGVSRIASGGSLDHLLVACVVLMLIITWFTPSYILSLAYDVGGIATSDVTVPLLTVIGIGLATHIDGANPLVDGFGLVALASIFPIITVMVYAILAELKIKFDKRSRA